MSQVAKTKENLKKCICMKCPSYTFVCKMKSMPSNILAMMSDINKLDHMEGLFCAFDKSKCIVADKGCTCSNCALYTQYKLDKLRYCIVTGGN